jgi:DNA-binding transcriptional ArsR family regulator
MREDVRQEIFQLHANLCKALADPKRLLIIETLRSGPRTVGDVSSELKLSQSNVSQHLAILRQRGVVRARRLGNNVFYSLSTPKVLRALDILREVMTEQLARGERLHAESRSAAG